ncbi:MAG TPA: cytochrome C oxidase subunit IV family protein [Gemmatimonadales bacterium]|jgi:cytochrome c oxidase subunit 4
MTATSSTPSTAAHKRPNYVMIWLYLFVLTVAEVALAFELPLSRNVKLLLLLFLAVWKALLVALFFMHLKFERWRLRLIFIIPLPLAAILITAVIMEKVF